MYIYITYVLYIYMYIYITYVSMCLHVYVYMLLSRFSHVRLCDPIDVSPPGSAVPGILQARTLEWVAISFSIHVSFITSVFILFK